MVLELGRLPSGATVSFERDLDGNYNFTIGGDKARPSFFSAPAKIEVYRADDDIRQLAAGYKTVEKSATGIDARAEIAYGNNVVFHVQDHWSLTGAVVSVSRKVEVTGNAPGGFDSSVEFIVSIRRRNGPT